jgi:hypothetical protein
MALSITKLGAMTLNKEYCDALSVINAKSCILIVILDIVMLNVIMLSVIVLS